MPNLRTIELGKNALHGDWKDDELKKIKEPFRYRNILVMKGMSDSITSV